MKWCLSVNQSDEYLKKADEIKIFMHDHKELDIIGLIEINPEARILIRPSFELTLFDDDYKKFQQYLILCKNNMAIIVSDEQQASKCKQFNIPFFFGWPARTFNQLNYMRACGATDAYIDDMVAHSLDIVEEYYNELQIRVIANQCGSNKVWDGIEGSWFRPEDLWEIDQIDVAEFYMPLASIPISNGKFATPYDARRQEQALYRIYAEKHAWGGMINDYVFDLKKKNIINSMFDYDFQSRRNNCRMKCMETGRCHYCTTYTNIALQENINKIKENINNG